MSHIGILCPGAIGHLNPMCNLGAELLHRGHKVTLFGMPDVREKIAQSTLEFYEIGASDFPPGSIETMYAELGKLTGLAGLKFAIELFKREAMMLFREAPEAIRNDGIDLLLVDQVTTAGGTIADYLKLPFIPHSAGKNRKSCIFKEWEILKRQISEYRILTTVGSLPESVTKWDWLNKLTSD